MNRWRFRGVLAALGAALTITASAARSDDWPQFRRDQWRTGRSGDRVQFPLTSVWTVSGRKKDGYSPLYHSVIKNGRIYFVKVTEKQRLLVCADAKTGEIRWQQALAADRLKFFLSDVTGPAVSNSGQVYVYDWVTAQLTLEGRKPLRQRRGQGSQSAGDVEPVNSFAVRVFRADNGEPLDMFPLAAMGANGVLPRLSLLHTPEGQEIRPVPPTFVGCPP
jgi:outer membrane protein assembly factor BamB